MRSLPLLAACIPLVAPALAVADDDAPPLSIYGFARLDVLANDSRMSAIDDASFVAAEPAEGDLDSALTMTPRLSRIGLSIDEWSLKGERIKGEGKLEIDFAGGSGANAIRLRHAYASITANKRLELLVGQTTDLLSPLFPSAQNDTQLRYAGNLGERRPQLRLASYPHHMVHVAVAAAASGVLDQRDMDGDGQIDAMASATPMLQWLVEFRMRASGDNIARVGVSGHAARQELANGTRHGSSSVAMHLMAPIGSRVMILGEGYVGNNLSDVGGGIGQGVNPTTDEPIRSLGGWIELAVLPTKRHMLAIGNSVDTVRPDDIEVGDRERNSTFYGVLRYKPRPSLQLGLEYLYWRTAYKEMADGVANRFDAHFSVFF